MYRYRFLLLVLFVAFTGCTGSRTVGTHSPTSLAEVNEVLAGRMVTVHLNDGTTVTGEGAAVFPDSVRFMTGTAALSTAYVRRITYERDRFSLNTGAGVGALVGLSTVGLCAVSSGDLSAGWCVAFGGIAVMGGAILGALLGVAEDIGPQERVAYEGSVTRYTSADVVQREGGAED